MIIIDLFLEILTVCIPEYSNVSFSPNFYAPENIIGPAWIHLLITRPNNKAMDAGNHSSGRKRNPEAAKLSINFSTCLF